MCGITGWVDFRQDLRSQRQVVEGMTEVLLNRGPDDYGYWFSDQLALGHRR
ncbi:MAG: Asparagine synthetase (glutamine-hydrolyzing) 3 [Dehalococcoidia bacterium]|nr:Asparagine synthetase (glutamine-hydrolyzing) 3 [Bacillota bacterium]MBT9141850.1 Asparagine synthetase (glutamine-hydrolyzing) 3 [Bacillota bacterium]